MGCLLSLWKAHALGWTGATEPAFWMHQLAVTTAPRLDPTVFRQHVKQLLAQ